MAYSRARTAVPGRHSRPPGGGEVRRSCLAVLTMLIAQYALGVFLNLFVTVPASERHASMVGEVTSGPFALTVHTLLGLTLIGTAIVLLARVVRLEDPMLIAVATTALGAIGGAFAAGEILVRDGGQDSAAFTVGLLTGLAMLCYVGMLALLGAPQRRHARSSEGPPAHARAESGLLADQDQDWAQEDWPEDAWSEPAWTGQPPLPVRRPQESRPEPTVVGVTWEAPWSQGPAGWR